MLYIQVVLCNELICIHCVVITTVNLITTAMTTHAVPQIIRSYSTW